MDPEIKTEVMGESVVIADQASADAAAKEIKSIDEEPELFVGDTIQFTQGPMVGTKGMIYYLDEELIRLLPTGVSDRLIDIDLTEEDNVFFNEETRIKKDPTALQTFVEIADLKEGNLVQTFDADGTPVYIYKVASVNLQEDSAVFKELDENREETGNDLELVFTIDGRVRGIERDIGFSVVRPQPDDGPVSRNEDEEEEEEEEEITLTKVLDEPEEDEDEVFEDRKAEDVLYQDKEQRDDFLEMERAALDPAKRSDPKLMKKLTRLRDSFFQLRNEISEYLEPGRSELKPVVYLTLASLLKEAEFPLAKQILNISKSVYLDHSEKHFDEENKVEDSLTYDDDTIDLHYLSDAVNDGIDFLQTEYTSANKELGAAVLQLPKFYTVFQQYFDNYNRSFLPRKSDTKSTIEYDRDFFRLNPLAILETPVLKGIGNTSDAEAVVNVDDIKEIGLSYMRAIHSRIGKYGDRKMKVKGVIEQGDEAEITHFVLFPLLFLRDLGSIRSGKLSIDIGNGFGVPQTMEMILTEGGGIEEIPRADSILLVNKDGTNVGNIELETWLKAQPLYGNGIGDILPFLKSFGLASGEFTFYQQSVLLQKIRLYQANVKKYISDIRKKSDELAKEKVSPKNFSFLDEDQAKLLFQPIEGQPILRDLLQKFQYYSPSWKLNDIACFAYLFKEFPDYLLAALSGLETVAQAQVRAAGDIALKRYFDIMAARQKEREEGQPPIKNDCDHVKNLEMIRKIRDEDKYVAVMLKEFLPIFAGKKEDHWIECKVCNKHLMCQHEHLMLLEHTHPKQKNEIHKKILFNYNGGVFNGKCICGNCGQPIQDIEYDNHLEFDDEGRPMVGSAPITDEMDESLENELNVLLEKKSRPIGKKTKEESSGDTELVVFILNEISSAIGAYIPSELDRMLRIIDRLMGSVEKDIDKYNQDIAKKRDAQIKKGEKPSVYPSYEEYYNQNLISYCATVLFVEIQSSIPDLTPIGVAPGCEKPSFVGFPLSPDESQLEGVVYLSCAVASLIRNEEPWRTTIWMKIPMKEKKRQDSILRSIRANLQPTLVDAEIITLLQKKREFLESKGADALTGRHLDRIPSDFLPILYDKQEEKNAEAPIIGDAATPSQKAYAWILQAHKLARASGLYDPGNPLSEASCCYSELVRPMQFWREAAGLPGLPAKQPPLGARGSTLLLETEIRKPERLLGEPDPELMYRLFLNVCFPREGIDNPRVGLPHEPGYDNKCPYCQFTFPVNPRLPPPVLSYSKDKKAQKQFDEEYKSEVAEIENKEIDSLIGAGAIEGKEVQKQTFERLLNATNSHFLIPREPPKTVATDTLDRLSDVNPEPFKGFKDMILQLKTNLQPLTIGAAEDEIRLAYAEVSDKARIFKELVERILKTRTTEATYSSVLAELKLLSSSPSQFVGESLRTFLLLPLQRLQSTTEFRPVGIESAKRRAIYSLIGPDDKKIINDFMNSHTDNSILRSELENLSEPVRDVMNKKITVLLEKLTVIIPLFIKVLRSNIVPFGSVGLPYIQNTILYGMLYEFVRPEELGGNLAAKSMLVNCLAKAQEPKENVLKSPDQIRKFILDDAEAEKQVIISKLDKMKPEQKRAELLMKSYGMGDWARGLKVKKYDVAQQEFEATQRDLRNKRGEDNFYNEDRKATDTEDGYAVAADDGENE